MNPNIIIIISDLLVNLAAGWIGAAVILPIKAKDRKLSILIFNFSFATIALVIAYFLRESL